MSDGVYLDNDVVLKLCTYQSETELIDATTLHNVLPAILGVAAFTLRSRVDRSPSISNREAVRSALRDALQLIRRLEPDAEEIEVAARLEQKAIERGLELDTGESQLFAMMIQRNARLLITGDKRALRALARLDIAHAAHRAACLEQLVLAIVNASDFIQFRTRVCAETAADRAISASFSCSSAGVAIDEVMQGLRSYINDLRRDVDQLLILSDDLSAVIS